MPQQPVPPIQPGRPWGTSRIAPLIERMIAEKGVVQPWGQS